MSKTSRELIFPRTPLDVPSTATGISSAKGPTNFTGRVEALRIDPWTIGFRLSGKSIITWAHEDKPASDRRYEQRQKVGNVLVHDRRGNHQPNSAGLLDLFHKVREASR